MASISQALPTPESVRPHIRDFKATDTRHVRRLIAQDVLAAEKRANWRVYTNPVMLYSLLPLTLVLLKIRSLVPHLPLLSSVVPYSGILSSQSPYTAGGFILLIISSCLILYVQFRHHRVFGAILASRLGQADLVNIVQRYYGSDGDDEGISKGVVKMLEVDRELRGVVCIDAKSGVQGQGRIRHFALNLPERTRRIAGRVLMEAALNDAFAVSTRGSPIKNSKAAPGRKGMDKILVLTDPLALEGERFYDELAFTAPSAVGISEQDERSDRQDLDGVIALRGRRKWMEITRQEWETRRR